MRAYRFAWRPSWLALHLLSVALIVTMVLLGRWQMHVSESKHFDIQNFGYALQWWAFSGFVVVMWWRVLRDRRRRDEAAARGEADPTAVPPAPPVREVVAYRRYVAPSTGDARTAQSADPVHSAYNDYLARLNAEDS